MPTSIIRGCLRACGLYGRSRAAGLYEDRGSGPHRFRALEALGHLVKQNRTDFMLEASEQRAQRVLLDRVVFPVSEEVYAEFVERLDARASPNERLKRTMATRAPWEAA